MTPRTTFVNNINPFTGLQTMATPQKPAKPSKAKTQRKDEDYSTTYKPPAPDAGTEQCNPKEGLAPRFVIEDSVPITQQKKAYNMNFFYKLLTSLNPGQSIKCTKADLNSMKNARLKAKSLGTGTFTSRVNKDTNMARIWRTA